LTDKRPFITEKKRIDIFCQAKANEVMNFVTTGRSEDLSDTGGTSGKQEKGVVLAFRLQKTAKGNKIKDSYRFGHVF
jgi:hypothetical protein